MNLLDTFAGIGGFSMGFEAEGFRTVGFIENHETKRIVLEHWWPGVPKFGDIREVTGQLIRETCGEIDVITGGSSLRPYVNSRKAAWHYR